MALSDLSGFELTRLADMVRRDAPALMSLPLEPDGKYQTRSMLLGELACGVVGTLSAAFRRIPPEDFPILHCAWGRARVGSTALANLFGMIGVPAYYQPVKALLRNALTGTPPESWTLRAGDGGAVGFFDVKVDAQAVGLEVAKRLGEFVDFGGGNLGADDAGELSAEAAHAAFEPVAAVAGDP